MHCKRTPNHIKTYDNGQVLTTIRNLSRLMEMCSTASHQNRAPKMSTIATKCLLDNEQFQYEGKGRTQKLFGHETNIKTVA